MKDQLQTEILRGLAERFASVLPTETRAAVAPVQHALCWCCLSGASVFLPATALREGATVAPWPLQGTVIQFHVTGMLAGSDMLRAMVAGDHHPGTTITRSS